MPDITPSVGAVNLSGFAPGVSTEIPVELLGGHVARPCTARYVNASRTRTAARSLGSRGGGGAATPQPSGAGFVSRPLPKSYFYKHGARPQYRLIEHKVGGDDVVDNITPPAGALTLTGYPPEVQAPVALTPDAAALTLTGFAPAVVQSTVVTPPAGALALTGHTPSLDLAITPSSGALALTGHAPAIPADVAITPPAGALVIAGLAPEIGANREATPPAGALTLTGHAPVIAGGALPESLGFVSTPLPSIARLARVRVATRSAATRGGGTSVTPLTPAAGALTLTGYAPTVAGLVIQPPAAALTLTGQAPTVPQSTLVTPPAGALALTGLVPEISLGIDIFQYTPSVGAIVVEGIDGITSVANVTTHTYVPSQGAIAVGRAEDGTAATGITQNFGLHIIATIPEAEIISGRWKAGDELIINRIIFSIDWDCAAQQFTKHVIYTFDDSVRKYGLKPALRLPMKGLHDECCLPVRGPIAILESRATGVAERFADPPPLLELTVPYFNHHWEVGDRIRVSSSLIPNIVTGTRGLVDEPFEIIAMQMMFAPEASVRLTLLDLEAVTVPGPANVFSPEDEIDLIIERSIEPGRNEITGVVGSLLQHRSDAARFPVGTAPAHFA